MMKEREIEIVEAYREEGKEEKGRKREGKKKA